MVSHDLAKTWANEVFTDRYYEGALRHVVTKRSQIRQMYSVVGGISTATSSDLLYD